MYEILDFHTYYLLRYGRLKNLSEKMRFCHIILYFYIISHLLTAADREKYSLSFGVSYVEIPAIVTEILVFHQGCTASPVSILNQSCKYLQPKIIV